MPQTAIRYLIVDDNVRFRSGLTDQLAAFPDLVLVGEASSPAQALVQLREFEPQVVLLDSSLPGMNAAELARAMLAAAPATAVCLLTVAAPQQEICDALAAGVRGLLPKESAIAAVHRTLTALSHGDSAIAPSLAIRFLATYYGCCPPPTTSGARFDLLMPRQQMLVYGVAQDWTTQHLAEHSAVALSTIKQQLHTLLGQLALRDRQQLASFAGELGLRTAVPV